MEGRYFEQQRIAEMLRGALAEMRVLCAEQSPSAETVEHVERWALRWIDLVEAMIWNTPAGADVDELHGALAQLKGMLPAIHSRVGLACAPGVYAAAEA